MKNFLFSVIAILVIIIVFGYVSFNNENLMVKKDKISEIISAPHLYHDKSVFIEGISGAGIGISGNGIYSLNDGSGEIYVLSLQSIPQKGEQIKVNGVVNQTFSVGGFEFITVIENSHE